jgi:hypothetical protein
MRLMALDPQCYCKKKCKINTRNESEAENISNMLIEINA